MAVADGERGDYHAAAAEEREPRIPIADERHDTSGNSHKASGREERTQRYRAIRQTPETVKCDPARDDEFVERATFGAVAVFSVLTGLDSKPPAD